MFFVNKSSCIWVMKSFSSAAVKDILLPSPLGEDCREEEGWPVNLQRRYEHKECNSLSLDYINKSGEEAVTKAEYSSGALGGAPN